MEFTIERLRQMAGQLGESIRTQASGLGEAARAKTQQIFDEWIGICPKLVDMGFSMKYFSLELSINPTLTVEFQAPHQAFPMERISQLASQWKANKPLLLVLTTMKTTLQWYHRTNLPINDPLVVRISVKLAPEIQVSLGRPHQHD